jgi:hypothetical protein
MFFENRVLRRVFERKRGKMTEECRKLHKELQNAFPSPNNIVKILLKKEPDGRAEK